MPDDNNPTNTQTPQTNTGVSSSDSSSVTDAPTSVAVNSDSILNPPAIPISSPKEKTSDESSNTSNVQAPHVPKKYGGGKVIATIFGILFLIGGVASGVYLVQRQQQIAERASSGRECQQSPNCILLESPGNSGSFTSPRTITEVLITAKDAKAYPPGSTNDGCYKVDINGVSLSWEKVGSGPDCKDISNIQVKLVSGEPTPTIPISPTSQPTKPPGGTPSPQPTTPPQITAKCENVKAYDLEWNLLSSEDLTKLKAGNKVRFAVSGTASAGTFDKARFTINGTLRGEVTTKKPGSDEFYDEYTVPQGVTNFTVKGEVHHSELGWM
ncbi:hypothetical protein A2962_00725 [Candidatus Woesebacteria bacterium RIFCSPLOWO2_01_FULL_39_61]|uniref:Uncharacterized protein n=1 Tax=Candidatus Woesebacteria bacterium RIFCSPHIGHO2_02_FULL_39_13 TaxID=1802505 RepID=A0A1F7Z213_9BACT|nr:MAG: hypothetical protein A3D01_01270 [Candidatus Woesebacteria bacterium RIFCSPHIGHO2_02_FULL_39_13]OGM36703.1 MAG: hypothetical protein A3E13_00220 [Candidatus Woesebacteria bacterium RIFCSPHIGHO2_12_FULL_40_20]OGM68576.1 MAG: hypothetical protein A2962_00725 [Candidatus Woesebacteria bacterium RIFCSPLOWO2_01_FULL_39_61]